MNAKIVQLLAKLISLLAIKNDNHYNLPPLPPFFYPSLVELSFTRMFVVSC